MGGHSHIQNPLQAPLHTSKPQRFVAVAYWNAVGRAKGFKTHIIQAPVHY
jgi:hypothetical protein